MHGCSRDTPLYTDSLGILVSWAAARAEQMVHMSCNRSSSSSPPPPLLLLANLAPGANAVLRKGFFREPPPALRPPFEPRGPRTPFPNVADRVLWRVRRGISRRTGS